MPHLQPNVKAMGSGSLDRTESGRNLSSHKMTSADLHSIPQFLDLQTDKRFVSLVMYLRNNPPDSHGSEPHTIIKDCGKLEEFNRVLKLIDSAFVPSKKIEQTTTYIPYSDENRKANQP